MHGVTTMENEIREYSNNYTKDILDSKDGHKIILYVY